VEPPPEDACVEPLAAALLVFEPPPAEPLVLEPPPAELLVLTPFPAELLALEPFPAELRVGEALGARLLVVEPLPVEPPVEDACVEPPQPAITSARAAVPRATTNPRTDVFTLRAMFDPFGAESCASALTKGRGGGMGDAVDTQTGGSGETS
jgi:hypothetical protein